MALQVLAAQARLAIAPCLYSIDQLPPDFSELRRMVRNSGWPPSPVKRRSWTSKACPKPLICWLMHVFWWGSLRFRRVCHVPLAGT